MKKRRSIYSILSFVIGCLMILLLIAGLAIDYELFDAFHSPLAPIIVPIYSFPYSQSIIALVGIVAGTLGLVRSEPKKFFALIGIIFTVAFNIYQYTQMRIGLETARYTMISTMNEVTMGGGKSNDVPGGSIYDEETREWRY